MFGRVTVFLFIVAIAVSSAFVVPTPMVQTAARATTKMAAEVSPLHKAAAAVGTALLTAAPVFATEGTSESLGIENKEMLWIPLAVVLGITTLYSQWVATQADDEDFFGEYDSRRN